MLLGSDPRLDVLIETAPRDRLRPLATALAKEAATSFDLAGDVRIARSLAQLESSPGAPMPKDAAQLMRELSARAEALRTMTANPTTTVSKYHANALRWASERVGAAATVRAATNPDPLAAALHTVYCAHSVLLPSEQDARENAVRSLLTDS